MIKRFLSVLLILCIMNIVALPVFSQEDDIQEDKILNSYEQEEIEDSRVIDAQFKTDLNVNKTARGQIVQFVSTQDYMVDGVKIPRGTVFTGEVKHFKKGRFGYRRAKAFIKINKMVLPNGEKYKIKAFTKKHVLKSSALANTGKGIVSFPIVIAVGAVGVVVIIVEAVSIVGILAIGPTTAGFGALMAKLTNGVNYKKHEGDDIKLKIKSINGAK